MSEDLLGLKDLLEIELDHLKKDAETGSPRLLVTIGRILAYRQLINVEDENGYNESE